MAEHSEPNWAEHLGNWGVFALTVAPFLSNEEIFKLSTSSRKLLRLRYELGRWAVELNDGTYESFRTKRHSVPLCFEGMTDFDL